MDIVIYCTLLLAAFGLFVKEIFPLEVSAILVLSTLVFTGILPAEEAFSGFGNQSIILIGSLFVLVGALQRTGIIKKLEVGLLNLSGESASLSFISVFFLVAFFSAFVSNTATLAVTIPVVVSISSKFGQSPRQWLLPLGFASLLGGMNSLVGTSTNIIISGLLPEYNIEPFSLFTTATIGFPLLLCGTIYLFLFRNVLLPVNEEEYSRNVEKKYELRSYTSELLIQDNSSLVHKPISASPIFREAGIQILSVLREGLPPLVPRGSLIMESGDRLVVEGNIDNLNEVLHKYGLVFADERETEGAKEKKSKKRSYDLELFEILVTARSPLRGRTPKDTSLRNMHRLSLVALNRRGMTVRDDLSDVRMRTGDILVVQFLDGHDSETLENLGLVALQQLKTERFKSDLAPVAVTLFICALILGSVTSVPIALCSLLAAALTVVFRVLRPDEIYRYVHWRILIFIAAILGLGRGMQLSGTADLIAQSLSHVFVVGDVLVPVGFFFLITVVFTQMLSNQATAVVMIPIAVSTAQLLGLPPMALIMPVTIAASCAFVTPFEPALMLVYGPGDYNVKDFTRLGLPLILIALAVVMIFVPVTYL